MSRRWTARSLAVVLCWSLPAGDAWGADILAPAKPSKPGAVVLEPKPPRTGPGMMGMMDHAFLSGWTRDGAFGYCVEDGATGETSCYLRTPGGAEERFSDSCPRGGEPIPGARKKIIRVSRSTSRSTSGSGRRSAP